MSPNQQLIHLRQLWALHTNHILVPRSSSFELFANCLAQILSTKPDAIECGPFTGHSALYLTALSQQREGRTFLLDNWSQSRVMNNLVAPAAMRQLLTSTVSLTGCTNFDIIDCDLLLTQYTVPDTVGFCYWDICAPEGAARAIHTMIQTSPLGCIYAVDDTIVPHNINTNFRDEFNHIWRSETRNRTPYSPTLVTRNRLYLSSTQTKLEPLLDVLVKRGHVTIVGWSQMYQHNIYCTMPDQEQYFATSQIVTDSDMWAELATVL
jgi:hypothetical protein